MRIAQIGNFSVPWCTEVHFRRSLESLGHDVVAIQENEWRGEVDKLDGASLLLYTHTHGWGPEDARVDAFLAECRRRGIPSAGVHLDLWRGLEREADVGRRPFFRVDHLFTADGSDEAWWRARGINHHWSPPAVLAESCYLAEPSPEFSGPGHDVVFAGQYNYHQEHPRAKLVDWLMATYGERFTRYPLDGQPAVREHQLNQLYASARVVVGDSCFAGKMPRYWSDRLPETLGRGGRLVFPRIEGLPADVPCRLFEAGNFADLREKIEDALAVGGEAAMQERRRAVAWTADGHTYRDRMANVLAVVLEGRANAYDAPVELDVRLTAALAPAAAAARDLAMADVATLPAFDLAPAPEVGPDGLPTDPIVRAGIEQGRQRRARREAGSRVRTFVLLGAALLACEEPVAAAKIEEAMELVRGGMGEDEIALVA